MVVFLFPNLPLDKYPAHAHVLHLVCIHTHPNWKEETKRIKYLIVRGYCETSMFEDWEKVLLVFVKCTLQDLEFMLQGGLCCFFQKFDFTSEISYLVKIVCFYSMFPKSTHETFAQKLYQTFKDHKRFIKPKLARSEFTIVHYAGEVILGSCISVHFLSYTMAPHWSIFVFSELNFRFNISLISF